MNTFELYFERLIARPVLRFVLLACVVLGVSAAAGQSPDDAVTPNLEEPPQQASSQLNSEPRWQSLGGVSGVGTGESSPSILALIVWDRDGAEGIEAPQLIAGGDFDHAGGLDGRGLARWSGSSWEPLGPGGPSSVDVYALSLWHRPGGEPGCAALVAGGSFSTIEGAPGTQNIGVFDGTIWSSLGAGLSGTVTALTEFDADGPGPLPKDLIAGGLFRGSAGVSLERIARWDGSAWLPLGAGMDGAVSALTTWDPDGPGPESELLIAGGSFLKAGGSSSLRVASWNGTAWSPMDTGTNGSVFALSTWDPDGPGPVHAELVMGGAFTAASSGPASYVARWDGTRWSSMGTGLNYAAYAFTTWDRDGAGPMRAELIAGGRFRVSAGTPPTNQPARWDGVEWHPIAEDIVSAESSAGVLALATWNFDDTGLEPPELVVGGQFSTASGLVVNHVARTAGTDWKPMGRPPLSARVEAIAIWDPDGEGGVDSQLVVGGSFVRAGAVEANRVAMWDGAEWTALGSGLGSTIGHSVFALEIWDPDGPGVGGLELVAGGSFIEAGEVPAKYVARWDGTEWGELGGGVNNDIYALKVWDPDGAGPRTPELVAGGRFTTAGAITAHRISSWNGISWRSFGSGIPSGAVWAIEVWDSDGPGPLNAELFVGGAIRSAGGVLSPGIARWDDTQWRPLGVGLTDNPPAAVYALVTWDPDGPGPGLEVLVAGGSFSSAGGNPAHGVAIWDGMQWSSIGPGPAGTNNSVYAFTTWDADGAGPAIAELVVGGAFSLFGDGANRPGLGRWDGAAWRPLGGGVNDSVHGLVQWDRDGPGPELPQLAVGGPFTAIGGQAAWLGGEPGAYLAMYGATKPIDTPHCPGDASGDRVVDFDDITETLANWGRTYSPGESGRGDSNDDGQVNHGDIAESLTNWGRRCE